MFSGAFEDLGRDDAPAPTKREVKAVLHILHVAEDLISHLPSAVVGRYCQLKDHAAKQMQQQIHQQSSREITPNASPVKAGSVFSTRSSVNGAMDDIPTLLRGMQDIREEMDSLLLKFATEFPLLSNDETERLDHSTMATSTSTSQHLGSSFQIVLMHQLKHSLSRLGRVSVSKMTTGQHEIAKQREEIESLERKCDTLEDKLSAQEDIVAQYHTAIAERNSIAKQCLELEAKLKIAEEDLAGLRAVNESMSRDESHRHQAQMAKLTRDLTEQHKNALKTAKVSLERQHAEAIAAILSDKERDMRIIEESTKRKLEGSNRKDNETMHSLKARMQELQRENDHLARTLQCSAEAQSKEKRNMLDLKQELLSYQKASTKLNDDISASKHKLRQQLNQ